MTDDEEHRLSVQAMLDATTETFGHLPDSFWRARPVFAHIRQAAHSRARSADAVLGCVLARIAALTPPCFELPAIAGAPAPLSVFVALVGPSGTGKSSSRRVATDLIPYDGVEVADDMPLGSGEGLIEVYFDVVDDVSPTGKPIRVKRQTRHGAFLFLDEGQLLAELGARKGSTLMPMLRTAWSGSTLGTTNATTETRRRLSAGSYGLGLVIAFQPSMAGDLLADAAGGTPQRFEWVSATDPNIPDTMPSWPGRLGWEPPRQRSYQGSTFTATLHVVDEVRRTVGAAALDRTRGTVAVDELDAHADLARLKIAGLFAILDNREQVTVNDWELAGVFRRTSRAVRSTIVEHVAIEERRKEVAAVSRVVRREGAVIDDQVSRARDSMARAIGRHVHRARCADGCSRRCATQATAGRDRQLASVDDAIEEAQRMRWITATGDTFTPGDSSPL